MFAKFFCRLFGHAFAINPDYMFTHIGLHHRCNCCGRFVLVARLEDLPS